MNVVYYGDHKPQVVSPNTDELKLIKGHEKNK